MGESLSKIRRNGVYESKLTMGHPETILGFVGVDSPKQRAVGNWQIQFGFLESLLHQEPRHHLLPISVYAHSSNQMRRYNIGELP